MINAVTVRDLRSTVEFYAGCIKLAELQFTGDCGRVLIVYPACFPGRAPRAWSSVENVKPEHRETIARILPQWRVDRIVTRK